MLAVKKSMSEPLVASIKSELINDNFWAPTPALGTNAQDPSSHQRAGLSNAVGSFLFAGYPSF